ncbi:hypothetical protein NEIMUCOT_05598 [Neisseria mucosa ATCC 25996]|uniref:Uncharacterized protein n=1 Tax=Neisseria mucosa (strain ATCC 25996 / DSM 4631 / NCTC 10774 / M26) TaxID=546266 RepID=D2ZY91_NEIM2|nr:hypothetical protein NEIMUCOT_05598 [Neisseria mucosa ATCC 25996]
MSNFWGAVQFSDDLKPLSLRYYSISKTDAVKQPSSADKPISCRSK